VKNDIKGKQADVVDLVNKMNLKKVNLTIRDVVI